MLMTEIPLAQKHRLALQRLGLFEFLHVLQYARQVGEVHRHLGVFGGQYGLDGGEGPGKVWSGRGVECGVRRCIEGGAEGVERVTAWV